MRLLLLASIAMTIGAATTHAHENVVPLKSVYLEVPDSLSADSMQMIYDQIDLLSPFDVKRMRDSFFERTRNHPSYLNRQVLLYLEERVKSIK